MDEHVVLMEELVVSFRIEMGGPGASSCVPVEHRVVVGRIGAYFMSTTVAIVLCSLEGNTINQTFTSFDNNTLLFETDRAGSRPSVNSWILCNWCIPEMARWRCSQIQKTGDGFRFGQ